MQRLAAQFTVYTIRRAPVKPIATLRPTKPVLLWWKICLFGQIRAQEITAPTGYKLDPIVHTYNITSGGDEAPFVFDNFSLRMKLSKVRLL